VLSLNDHLLSTSNTVSIISHLNVTLCSATQYVLLAEHFSFFVWTFITPDVLSIAILTGLAVTSCPSMKELNIDIYLDIAHIPTCLITRSLEMIDILVD